MAGSKGSSGLFPKEATSNLVTVSKSKTWTSKDPLVGELATDIDKVIPNSVVAVNKIVKDVITGKIITDFDIETKNVVIQVKSGGGKGLTAQMNNTKNCNNKRSYCLWTKY